MAPFSTLPVGSQARAHFRAQILKREDWPRWLEGGADDTMELCKTGTAPLAADRTSERWAL